MYSGSTLTNLSGSVLGAHQKVDRQAYKNLKRIVGEKNLELFPSLKGVLHFEGKNGPDGIKRKSPAKDEPWHFYNPFDEDDTELLQHLGNHYKELVSQLKSGGPERAAFDAAWLGHTIVDGLTPAHHFPYEEKLAELRGEGMETRSSIKDKLVIPGDNLKEKLKNNWEMWGPNGLMSMHGLFEIGVAVMMAPLQFGQSAPSEGEISLLNEIGIEEYFKRTAREVALLDMYDRFCEKGWTVTLARQVRNDLGPALIKTVTLSWYSAMREAKLLVSKK